MPALLQTLRLAIATTKQSALQTPSTNVVSLRQTSKDIPQAEPINESDKDDIGKGVYATQLFPSHMQTRFRIDGHLSSEWAAILSAFGTGKNLPATTPDVGGADGLEMPATTIVAAIGQGTNNVITDKALIGMCCEKFGFTFKSGPGRQNAMFTSEWIGCGKIANPSLITIPPLTDEHLLNSGGMTVCSINGIDYLTTHRFVQYDFEWANNIRTNSMFFPGSGNFNNFQIGGRMRRGSPVVSNKIIVEAETGSSEEANLLNQVAGTSHIAIQGATGNSIGILLNKVVPKTTPLGENDGIVTYIVDLEPLQDATLGVLTIDVQSSIAVAV